MEQEVWEKRNECSVVRPGLGFATLGNSAIHRLSASTETFFPAIRNFPSRSELKTGVPHNRTNDPTMKTSTTTFCIACCLTAGLTFAQEGERKPGGPGPGGEGGPNRMAEFLKKIDADADGKISKDEFAAFSKKEGEDRFAKIDSNADGVADEAEMKAAAEKMRSAAGGGGERGMMRRPGGEGSPGEGGFRRPPEGQGRPEGAPRPEGGPRPEGQGRPEGGPPGQGGPGGMMRGMGNPEDMIKRMDKNTDGGVDLAEYKEFASQEVDGRFKMMDGNSDGKITADEFKQIGERMRGMMRGGQPGQGGPPGGAPGQGGGFRRPGGEGGSEGGFRRPPSQDGEGAPKPAGEKKPEGI